MHLIVRLLGTRQGEGIPGCVVEGYAGGSVPLPEATAYTDGASTGARGPGGYGVVIRWEGKTKEISGGEPNTTNLRMELTAACVALETIEVGYTVNLYSDASYLINCMRRGWYEKWRENGWLTYRDEAVANKDLWERLLEAARRHQQVRWRKVKGHRKTQGPHKSGNDRADELAVTAKNEVIRPSMPPSPLRNDTCKPI